MPGVDPGRVEFEVGYEPNDAELNLRILHGAKSD